MDKRIVTPKEAAEFLGVSEPTMSRLLISGAVPGTKIGKRWFIPKAYLDGLTTKGVPEGEAGQTDADA